MPSTKFQSSPGAMAGCNQVRDTIQEEVSAFQSSPGAMAGCNPYSYAWSL